MICNQQNKHSAILQVEDLAVTQTVKIFGLFFLLIQFNSQSSTAKFIFLIHVDVEIAVVHRGVARACLSHCCVTVSRVRLGCCVTVFGLLHPTFQPAGADLCDGPLRQLPVTGRYGLRRGVVRIQVRSIGAVWKRHGHGSHGKWSYRIRIENDLDPRLI